MKRFTQASIAAMAAGILSFSAPAYASDLFGGSTKDDPGYVGPVYSPTGLYIKGDLGIARTNRTIDQSIGTSKNYLCKVNEDGSLDDEDCPDGGLADQVAPEIPNALGPSIYTDLLQGIVDDNNDSTVFGGELSYLYVIPSTKFGVEIGLGGTFYHDNKTSFDFGPEAGTITSEITPGQSSPDLSGIYDKNGDGLNDFVEHTGETTFERNHDIDLVLKAHGFINPNVSLYAGGGVSWAQATLKTAHTTGYDIGGGAEGVFDNAFKQDDNSLGYVLVAGVQAWLTDRITLGAEYSYKHHEFDFSDGKSTDAHYRHLNPVYRYGVSDEISVDDDVHAVKARLGIKLN